MTTLLESGSYPNQMNLFNKPVWLLGGLPGGACDLRLRILFRAIFLTSAPKRVKTFLAALSTDAITCGESKNIRLNFTSITSLFQMLSAPL